MGGKITQHSEKCKHLAQIFGWLAHPQSNTFAGIMRAALIW
jgi:hypothetical protein